MLLGSFGAQRSEVRGAGYETGRSEVWSAGYETGVEVRCGVQDMRQG